VGYKEHKETLLSKNGTKTIKYERAPLKKKTKRRYAKFQQHVNRQVRSSEISHKTLGEQTPSLKGLLKYGICINNALQYSSNAIFIAATSKTNS